ncbi:unnamed protein product [Thlaspi arvense]|uniref:DUF295 domain-containing protein n=1 Tax=Thlaspi arvense TaxID=13288 RepID=A0AAU9T4Q7_THLAR|nr:unnamed protein product [Thlaspi arvense]
MDTCGVSTFLRGQFQRIHFSSVRHTRPLKKRAGHVVSPICVLPLTEESVEIVLDEVRPSLMADGGNVALHEIDGLVVVLKLQGACGSCPSSSMTLKMGIESRLRDKIPEIMAVEQFLEPEAGGLELNEENIEKVLSELRPYLSGTGGGGLELVEIDGYVVKVRLTGPAAGVMTVRVALTQKLRETIPSIGAVQLLDRLFRPSVCKNIIRRTNVRLFSSTTNTSGSDSDGETTVTWPSSGSTYPFLMVDHILYNKPYCSKKKQLLNVDKTVGEQVCDAMTVGFSRDGLRYSLSSKDGLVIHYKPSNPKLKDMTVHLPPLPKGSKIQSLAMSSLPKRDKDWVVGVKLSGSRLSLCNPFGRSEWIDIRKAPQSINPSSSLMFSKKDDRFYIPSNGGNYLCSLESDDDYVQYIDLRFDDLPNSVFEEFVKVSSCARTDHLVESPTGLQFLVKYGIDSEVLRKDSEEHEFYTTRLEDVTEKFMVFREGQESDKYDNKTMIYTEDIGDLCIFLGHSEAFCVPASSSPGLKPNCIYFFGRNFGVYNLITKTCKTFCLGPYNSPLRRLEFPYWPSKLPL